MNELDGSMSTGAALVVLAVLGTAVLSGGVLFGSPEDVERASPQRAFTVAGEDDALTVTYVGDEALAANGSIHVRVEDAETGDVVDRPWLAAGRGSLRPGDAVTFGSIDVNVGDAVSVVRQRVDAEGVRTSSVLAEFELGAGDIER